MTLRIWNLFIVCKTASRGFFVVFMQNHAASWRRRRLMRERSALAWLCWVVRRPMQICDPASDGWSDAFRISGSGRSVIIINKLSVVLINQIEELHTIYSRSGFGGYSQFAVCDGRIYCIVFNGKLYVIQIDAFESVTWVSAGCCTIYLYIVILSVCSYIYIYMLRRFNSFATIYLTIRWVSVVAHRTQVGPRPAILLTTISPFLWCQSITH